MTKYTLVVDGMMCGMCESHVNDAVRKAFPVKKVTSSHEQETDRHGAVGELRALRDATGYRREHPESGRPRRGGQRAPRPCGPAENRPPIGTPPPPPAPRAPGTRG
ncbi:hypothetical protein M5E87_24950 [Flavonifractor plautii]|nr:hypothetical protein M5E87_24950 [Flavonifractor plautii]